MTTASPAPTIADRYMAGEAIAYWTIQGPRELVVNSYRRGVMHVRIGEDVPTAERVDLYVARSRVPSDAMIAAEVL